MEWINKVYNCISIAQFRLFPPLCTLCGRPGEAPYDLCSGCLHDLPRNSSCCQCCALPLAQPAQFCGECAQNPPPYASSIIPFRYAPPLDFLIQQLKFHQRLQQIPTLARLLAEAVLAHDEPLPDALVPVPMGRGRLRERGYNQALELARPLSQMLAVPLQWQSCRRTIDTAPQTGLDGAARRRNLRGAFAVAGELPPHVAIVDDVVTTGTTVAELARTLRRAGVARVDVWAVARAGRE